MCDQAGAQNVPAAMDHMSQKQVADTQLCLQWETWSSAAVAGDFNSPGEPAKDPCVSHGTLAQLYPKQVQTSAAA